MPPGSVHKNGIRNALGRLVSAVEHFFSKISYATR